MAIEAQAGEAEAGFAESLLGRSFLEQESVKKFMRYPAALRAAVASAGLSALILIPYLGAVGLWDCWEVHYGEVAREMMARRDYVFPWWEATPFFSKPPLTMWMQALGMHVTGKDIEAGPGELGLYTEWGFRMPFALFSILAVGLLVYALARTVSTRAGLATGFVLSTMPLWFLVSRQAVTDTPVVSSLVCAMACAMVGLFDRQTQRREAWWYAFYVFLSLGTFAKGLLGFGIPAVILVLFAVLVIVPWNERALESHARWLFKRAGLPLFAAVAVGFLAWALTLAVTKNRFHGITPALILIPAVASVLLRRALDKPLPPLPLLGAGVAMSLVGGIVSAVASHPRNLGIGVVLVVLGGVLFLLQHLSQDEAEMPVLWGKFYEMRFASGVALFFVMTLPWFHRMFAFESVDEEGKLFWFRFLIHDHFARLTSGVHTTTPGGDFTYFIQQGGYAIYPWVVLLPGAAAVVARLKMRGGTTTDQVGVLSVLWLCFTFALIGASATKFHHYVMPMLPPLAVLMGMYVAKLWEEGPTKHAATLAFGLPLLFLVGKDLSATPKNFTDLFVYNYDRPYPEFLTERPIAFWSNRPLSTGDLVAFALLGLGGYLCFEAFGGKRSAWLRALSLSIAGAGVGLVVSISSAGSASPMLLAGAFMLAGPALLVLEALKASNPNRTLTSLVALLGALPALGLAAAGAGLQVTSQADPLWATLAGVSNVKQVMGFGFLVFGILGVCLLAARAKLALFATMAAGVLAFTLWFNWFHWVDLSHHWTQRDQFWRYFRQR
ncbi:MAG: glycosyltransferase family 39 protein, partial [Myxococcaceae bacterium]|nr:glycosyltransferase family 39 protein [Myxococcaceae bacterium]